MFVAVAVKSDWNNHLKIPKNVTLYFDTSQDKYYKLLENAHISIFPLRDDRVSGLVNIIKSIQYGKLTLTTKLKVTENYYPDNQKELLTPLNDLEGWVKLLQKYFEIADVDYIQLVEQMQDHLKKNFSPESAVEKLDRFIKIYYEKGPSDAREK